MSGTDVRATSVSEDLHPIIQVRHRRSEITQETLGNGLVTNRVFDAATGLISSIKCGMGGGTCAQNQSYLFDLVGNLTQRQNNNLGLTENFYYDDLYRLDYSTLNGVVNLDLSYDALGNITSRSDVAGGAAWTYNSVRKHQMQQVSGGSASYSYDANGNVVTRNGFGITWNAYNYPTIIYGNEESTTLSYDANQQRWKQIYSGSGATETTTYVGGLLQKVNADGIDDYRHLIYANGSTVAIMSRTTAGANTTNYLLRDYQGSIVKIASSTGSSVVSESFTAFGERRNPATWSGVPTHGDRSTSATVTREGYTGHDALGGMGLNHMNGRVQDAITGRFLSADPYVSDAGDTQAYNRYSYVNNNPMSATDPSGFRTHGNSELPIDVLEGVTVERTRINGGLGLFGGGTGNAGGDLGNRGRDGHEREIIEEVITAASKLPPDSAPLPSLSSLVGFFVISSANADGITSPTQTIPDVNSCIRGDFWNSWLVQHGSLTFSANGGRLYGGGFSVSVSGNGISWWLGAGVGMGAGVSVTGDISAGDTSGWGIFGSASGGNGTIGGQATGTMTPHGPAGSVGVGWGIGAGGSFGIGYQGTLTDWSGCQ